MLISIVMDPACLAPEILSGVESRVGAETILQGVIENGVLLAPDTTQYINLLATAASRLGSQVGQHVQLLLAEIAKNCKMLVAAERSPNSTSGRPMDSSELQRLALALRADAIVCRNVREVRSLAKLRRSGIEICTLSEYRYSRTEAKRKKWLQTTRIDQLPVSQSAMLVGRTIRYATEIIVVDRFFAAATKDGRINKRLERFVQGLLYLAMCWKKHSPYTPHSVPSIHLFSVAGHTGASGGYIDPNATEKIIRKAVSRFDSRGNVGNLHMSLKADDDPPIAKDRFVSALGRCFGVQHGIDDIGRLIMPKSRPSPTSFIPDCQDYRDLLTEIKGLPAAR